jgi:hypothetical protein
MDRILKLVYDNWVNGHPVANGIHPIVFSYLQTQQDKSTVANSDLVAFRDHNNFRLYFKKHHPHGSDVESSNVQDDGAIYLYPIEIKTTLMSLYSTHVFSLNGVDYSYSLKDVISPTTLHLVQQGKVKIVINYIHDPINNISDIENIEQYFNTHGIDSSMIIIVSGNSFDSYNGKITICRGHLFEQQAAEKMLAYPRMSSLGYLSDNVRFNDLNPTTIRQKKFLSFNRQMSHRPHRVMLAYLAIKYDLLKDGLFSFVGNVSADEISDILQQFTQSNKLSEDVQKLIPFEIDTHNLQQDRKTSFSTDNNKKEFYLDSYIHITSETGFDSTDVFLSEKTFRPIVNLQPFLSFGNVGCLRDLQELGFKTFHPYIDETYDLEKNPIRRMQLLETELKKLADMSIEQIHQLYYSLVDVLIHNQEHLKTFKDTDPYRDIIKVI